MRFWVKQMTEEVEPVTVMQEVSRVCFLELQKEQRRERECEVQVWWLFRKTELEVIYKSYTGEECVRDGNRSRPNGGRERKPNDLSEVTRGQGDVR